MKERVEDVAHKIFFEICGKKPTEIDLFFLDTIHFPKIDYLPIMTVYLPMPRKINGHSVYEGIVFSEYESGAQTIWNLFFATVCHAAAHASVTDFSKYQNWIKDKDKDKAYKTIEKIEDIKINHFLKTFFPEYYQGINKINNAFKIINEKNIQDKLTYKRNKFIDRFGSKKKIEDVIKNNIIKLDSKDKNKIIEIADKLYFNQNIIEEENAPYVDHYTQQNNAINWKQNVTINPSGTVEKNVQNFIDIWFEQQKRRDKTRKKYGGLTHDLNFDKIEFAPENIGEYLRLRNATHMFLKKMSSQMKLVPNIMDEGIPEDMGLLQMQAAIQAVAAQNNSIQIFEQDDYRKIEEEWAVVLDTSSSMRLKFDEMKKFAIALGEAANDVNSKNGKWGFFTFNNNFRIVKDHYEKYDQTARSRVGGIEITGLSFIGDAVKLCTRILERENIEKKFIFLITDGQQVGTLGNNKDMEDAILEARKKGITVIAIGLPEGITKVFNLCIPYESLRKTVAKFISAYARISGEDT
ncbi:vWA domain-containing protein [Nitrosarchaeum sp. AC2]|uniref:vWA domain-containing protein n=1 Tax=Nitrosarchaeum sp. AC2 TaxID=2259673 RepID=UPI0015CA8023|nr:vWA domain-containing protein [Nitrosarchaeum sp. AC2]QLH10799.1 VWA domain-containing protein [Nitrosarchaeum sp. AC2]